MPTPFRRVLAGLFAASLLSAALVTATSSPASAHDALIASYPSAESTVDGSPDEITLNFSAALNPDPSTAVIEVIASDGSNYATDPPSIVDTSVTQHLLPDPPDGRFVVRWKVVSSDGHPISGEYAYSVATTIVPAPTDTPTASPTSAPSPTATPTPTATPDGVIASDDAGSSTLVPILVAATGIVVLAVVVTIVVLGVRGRRRRDEAGTR